MSERQWHYAVNGKTHGPLAESELKHMLAAGSLAPDTMVWSNRVTNTWMPANTVAELWAAPPSVDLKKRPLDPPAERLDDIGVGQSALAIDSQQTQLCIADRLSSLGQFRISPRKVIFMTFVCLLLLFVYNYVVLPIYFILMLPSMLEPKESAPPVTRSK